LSVRNDAVRRCQHRPIRGRASSAPWRSGDLRRPFNECGAVHELVRGFDLICVLAAVTRRASQLAAAAGTLRSRTEIIVNPRTILVFLTLAVMRPILAMALG
jgi:hypothetical protein